MEEVFADTGYWVAITVVSDKNHARAAQLSGELAGVRIVTTEMVLAEFLAALAKIPTRGVAVSAVDAIQSDPNLVVVPQTSRQFRDALEMYRQRGDKEWSLTDCASFTVMRSRGIEKALAHDHHFEQAGFAALLR